MYINKLFSIFVLIISTTLNVEAQLKGKYPPVDRPPQFDVTWAKLVDRTKLVKAPIRVPGQCDPVDPYCVWSCTNCLRPESDVMYCPDKSNWAFTYDDGPSKNTLKVLDELNARGIKATFFVTGSRVYENPDILKKLVDSGHQIGSHTWSHSPLTTQSDEQIIAEVKWTEQAIKEAVNLTPKWFRPPQGDFDDRVRGILTQLGYKIAIWDLDTFDWHSNGDPTYDLNWITGNFSTWVQNKTSTVGHISLQHDIYDKPVTMVSKSLDIVLDAKFVPESLSVCLNEKAYIEDVQLPKSKVKASDAGTGTGTGTGSQPPVISKNSASSVKSSILLSMTCGLMMMIFGFVGNL